ncbi:TPM domain-containing protein, partial [Methylacidiphilales bacterium]|nr:TPM domain-containing protein [Candidatus Methylacidiphilales bacterium]MDB4793692.1 TPM domain-containing protein [Candidatus Methylacidiphilales bacterium]
MMKRQNVRRLQRIAVWVFLFLAWGGFLLHAQTLPPKPDRYFTDQAGVVDAGTADAINRQLDQFERDTSNQILVAIYPSLPPNAEVYQYGTQVAASWAPGQKNKNNGAVLFVFIQDHKIYIAVGRGLEGVLPDAICNRIISQQITPLFRQGNYAGGIQAGVNAMLAATKGEYTGNGSTQDDRQRSSNENDNQFSPWIFLLFIIIFIIIRMSLPPGYRSGPFIFTGG